MDQSTAPKPSRFYLPALDGLRIVAFMMVWLTHAFVFPTATEPGVSWSTAGALAGAYGVPVFFVLSAYLITKLLMKEKEGSGTVDLRAYYIRRTLRIWPLYFLIVALAIAEWRYRNEFPKLDILSIVTFTANWRMALHKAFDSFAGVLWSVSVEEQFYLVWPLALLWLSKRGLAVLSWSMVAVALVSRVVFVLRGDDGQGVWFSTLTHLDALGLGTLLALGSFRLRLDSLRWHAALIGCLAALVIDAKMFPFRGSSEPFGVSSAVGYTLVPFVAALMVALAVDGEKTFLAKPWAVYLGKLTYGMYCFHYLVLLYLPNRGIKWLVASLAITFGLAWLSFNFYEVRFLRLKKRFERVESRPA